MEENYKDAMELIKKFFEENPKAIPKPQPDGHIFSPELRSALAPLGKMDVREALQSEDFWRRLCKHAGMPDETFEKILNGDNDD